MKHYETPTFDFTKRTPELNRIFKQLTERSCFRLKKTLSVNINHENENVHYLKQKNKKTIIGREKHETLSTLVKFLKFQLYNLNFSDAEDQDIMST